MEREKILHIRLPGTDYEKIVEVSDSLDLPVTEIARRSLRLGLKKLGLVKLPGGSREVEVEPEIV